MRAGHHRLHRPRAAAGSASGSCGAASTLAAPSGLARRRAPSPSQGEAGRRAPSPSRGEAGRGGARSTWCSDTNKTMPTRDGPFCRSESNPRLTGVGGRADGRGRPTDVGGQKMWAAGTGGRPEDVGGPEEQCWMPGASRHAPGRLHFAGFLSRTCATTSPTNGSERSGSVRQPSQLRHRRRPRAGHVAASRVRSVPAIKAF